MSNPRTGEILTARELTSYQRGEPRPDHYLDYFHGGLVVSLGGTFVADNGWVWSPVGMVVVWDIHHWVKENPWESEDGPSRHTVCSRWYHWDGPLCWVADDRLAVWGYGADDEWLIPAVRVFNAVNGRETHWFPGPRGELVYDCDLFCFDAAEGMSVWDVGTGERLFRDEGFCPTRYHPGAKTFLTPLPGGAFRVSRLRRPGGPLESDWASETAILLARGIRADRGFDRLPILADALEEAGCQDEAVLAHCRDPGSHGNRCWVVDRILDNN